MSTTLLMFMAGIGGKEKPQDPQDFYDYFNKPLGTPFKLKTGNIEIDAINRTPFPDNKALKIAQDNFYGIKINALENSFPTLRSSNGTFMYRFINNTSAVALGGSWNSPNRDRDQIGWEFNEAGQVAIFFVEPAGATNPKVYLQAIDSVGVLVSTGQVSYWDVEFEPTRIETNTDLLSNIGGKVIIGFNRPEDGDNDIRWINTDRLNGGNYFSNQETNVENATKWLVEAGDMADEVKFTFDNNGTMEYFNYSLRSNFQTLNFNSTGKNCSIVSGAINLIVGDIFLNNANLKESGDIRLLGSNQNVIVFMYLAEEA